MNKHISFILLLPVLLQLSCAPDTSDLPSIGGMAVSWHLISNQIADEPRFQATFTLTNKGDAPIEGTDWSLLFNQTPRAIIAGSIEGPADIQRLTGDLYKLDPAAGFSLLPGDSLTVTYEGEAWLIKETDAPVGLYFVLKGKDGVDTTIPVADYKIWPFENEAQYSRHKNDLNPYPDETWTYDQNAKVQKLAIENLPPIIPTPQMITAQSGTFTLSSQTKIYAPASLQEETKQLNSFLTKFLTQAPEILEDKPNNSANTIELALDGTLEAPEGYRLEVSPKYVRISGGASSGVFYGIQSFLSLLPVEVWREKTDAITVNAQVVKDAPRFEYRGMHIDISRNYNDQAAIMKLMDAMAFYKLNKLHLHLTDDEGWRLEIPGLPELTEYGSKRGHTADEYDRLAPAYGSGSGEEQSYGSGYLKRTEFIELIQYAAKRHIEVIPELNVPGHARAAVKAMEARYRRLSVDQKKEAAEEFRLADPNDQSEYRSVQNYPDNVICVCCEGTYRFYEKIVDEVRAMFTEAGVRLTTIHTGGDEVPIGVWTASPACKDLVEQESTVESLAELPTYFFNRINQILLDRNLKSAGWEEIVMKKTGDGWIPHPDFLDRDVIPYVWNNLWGNQDLGYRLANAGYPVVLCNVTNLYFDMAYSRDPLEPGLYWGGFVDTRKVFDFRPFDIFQSTATDAMGNPIDADAAKQEMEQLNTSAQRNILGVQGQIWSESLKGPDMLEYYYFPKMLGLSERAWGPALADGSSDAVWEIFANQLGQRELHRLEYLAGGYNYRLPPPGAKIIDGKAQANVAFPGLTIRYTTDGGEPGTSSPIYSEPLPIDSLICFKAFDERGRSSRVVCIAK